MAPLSRVVAYAPPGANGLALGMASAVFGPRPGITDFEFTFCSDAAGLLSTDMGLPVSVDSDVSALDSADLVLVLPGERCRSNPSPAAIAALRSARERGAIVAAHCVGVFLLASAELACMYPLVRVRPEALYLDQGGIATGAGAAAGLDLYLHLIRREIGATVANELARILVIPPHRDGGQQQFIAAPVPADADGDRLAGVIGWARENLHQDMSVETLAARALMSRRSFVRHFKAATGATPHAWLLAQRLNRAEELLESTDLPIERVAAQVGYRSAAVFREQFVLRRGVAPRDYRRTFSHAA
jgi:transcriptional regulator GlxA family with amidase domain